MERVIYSVQKCLSVFTSWLTEGRRQLTGSSMFVSYCWAIFHTVGYRALGSERAMISFEFGMGLVFRHLLQ